MTLYEKRLARDIKARFDGLSEKQLQSLIKYYFEYLGDEGGCEECYEEHYLCAECELMLADEARRLTKLL